MDFSRETLVWILEIFALTQGLRGGGLTCLDEFLSVFVEFVLCVVHEVLALSDVDNVDGVVGRRPEKALEAGHADGSISRGAPRATRARG